MSKVLIVEDNELNLKLFHDLLKIKNHTVIVSKDGVNVLNIAIEQEPDLILMDIKMSGKDGRVICRELKSKSRTKNIPIILLSASHQLHDSALEAGADDFMAKPFSMNELLEKIIFIGYTAVKIIDVPTDSPIRHHDDHRSSLAGIHHFICNLFDLPKLSPTRFVVSISMQQIKYRITSTGGIITFRKINGIIHFFANHPAIEPKTFE